MAQTQEALSKVRQAQKSLSDNETHLKQLTLTCMGNYDGASDKMEALKVTKDHLKVSLLNVANQLCELSQATLQAVNIQGKEIRSCESTLCLLENRLLLHKTQIGRNAIDTYIDLLKTERTSLEKRKTVPFENKSEVELSPIDFSAYDNVGIGGERDGNTDNKRFSRSTKRITVAGQPSSRPNSEIRKTLHLQTYSTYIKDGEDFVPPESTPNPAPPVPQKNTPPPPPPKSTSSNNLPPPPPPKSTSTSSISGIPPPPPILTDYDDMPEPDDMPAAPDDIPAAPEDMPAAPDDMPAAPDDMPVLDSFEALPAPTDDAFDLPDAPDAFDTDLPAPDEDFDYLPPPGDDMDVDLPPPDHDDLPPPP